MDSRVWQRFPCIKFHRKDKQKMCVFRAINAQGYSRRAGPTPVFHSGGPNKRGLQMIGVSPGRQWLAVKVCSWPIRGCRHRIHLFRPRTELAMKIYHGLWMENLRWADLFQSSTDRRAAEVPKIGRATSAAYCGLTNEVSDQLDHPSSLVSWRGVKQCHLEWVTSPLVKLLN